MQGNERKRILTLVENGTISAEEAIVLLEKLEKGEDHQSNFDQPLADSQNSTVQKHEEVEPIHTESMNQTTEEFKEKKKTTGFEDFFEKAFNSNETNKKFDDIVNELKKDLSDFGNKMTTIFNSTLSKVKGFEADVPFGEKVEFKNNYAFNAEEVKGIELDLPNSKIDVQKATDDILTLDVTVKTTLQGTEDETKQAFFENFVELLDGKLHVKTISKLSQVQITVYVPEKEYDIFYVRSLNSDVKINSLHVKVLKVALANGPIQLRDVDFHHAELQSKNGSIETRFITGEDLEVETMNGRIFIEGELREVEAESINGHVVVTTTSDKAHKVKATTVAGAVELYLPKTVALDGKLTTNFGKIDLGLQDINQKLDDESLLQKVTHFDKALDDASLLKVVGESKTGSLIVRYNP